MAVEKLKKKKDKETTEEFERVKRLRQELRVSLKSGSQYEPFQQLHTHIIEHQPGQLKEMLQKEVLCLKISSETRILVRNIVGMALLGVDDSLAKDDTCIHVHAPFEA